MWKPLLLTLLSLASVARAAERTDAWFPLIPNATWKYRATIKPDAKSEPQTAEQTVTVERKDLAGTPAFVAGDTAYAAKDDGVYVVGVVRGGKIEPLDEPQKVVPADPKVGDKWTYREADGVTAATCLGVEKVKVGAGEYDAVKIYLVTSGGADGNDRRDVYRWFAKDVGPVKGTVTVRKVKEDGTASVREITLELLQVEFPRNNGALPAAVEDAKADLATLFAQGEALAKKGEQKAALARYDAALAQDPKAAKVHAYKALSLISTRQFEAAERSIEAALALNGKEYTYHEIAGQLKLAQGKTAEGKALYDKAAKMSPENAGAVYTDLAAVLSARKDDRLNPEILKALEQAAAATPPSAELLSALGQTYASAGRPEGRRYLERYIAEAAKQGEGKRDEQKVRLAKQLIRALDAVKGAP